MTKYLDPKFQSPPNSKKYRDNWDKIFGDKKEKDVDSDDSEDPSSR